MPAETAQIFIKIICFVGSLDNRGLLHPFFTVKFLQTINIIVDNQICDNRAFLRVERHVLFIRANHLNGTIAHQISTGLVPEHDPVIPTDDEGRNGGSLDNSFNGLFFSEQFFLPVFVLPETAPFFIQAHLTPSCISNG